MKGLFALSAALAAASQPGAIEIHINGVAAAMLYYAAQGDKPFVHPLRTPSGVVLSRGWPVTEGSAESEDHPWHRGIWWGHGDINGVDFWREIPEKNTGRIVVRKAPRQADDTVAVTGELTTRDGKVLGTIEQGYRFRDRGAERAIDCTVSIRADRGVPLKLGDTEEGFLGIRLRDEFRQDRGAILMNSDGLKTTEKIWGRRAKWTSYTAIIFGKPAGAAIFDHPSNPRHPTWWHARGYGLNAANPLGERDFTGDKSRDGSMVIPAGNSLTFRYRVVLHDGPGTKPRMDALYAEFAAQ